MLAKEAARALRALEGMAQTDSRSSMLDTGAFWSALTDCIDTDSFEEKGQDHKHQCAVEMLTLTTSVLTFDDSEADEEASKNSDTFNPEARAIYSHIRKEMKCSSCGVSALGNVELNHLSLVDVRKTKIQLASTVDMPDPEEEPEGYDCKSCGAKGSTITKTMTVAHANAKFQLIMRYENVWDGVKGHDADVRYIPAPAQFDDELIGGDSGRLVKAVVVWTPKPNRAGPLMNKEISPEAGMGGGHYVLVWRDNNGIWWVSDDEEEVQRVGDTELMLMMYDKLIVLVGSVSHEPVEAHIREEKAAAKTSDDFGSLIIQQQHGNKLGGMGGKKKSSKKKKSAGTNSAEAGGAAADDWKVAKGNGKRIERKHKKGHNNVYGKKGKAVGSGYTKDKYVEPDVDGADSSSDGEGPDYTSGSETGDGGSDDYADSDSWSGSDVSDSESSGSESEVDMTVEKLKAGGKSAKGGKKKGNNKGNKKGNEKGKNKAIANKHKAPGGKEAPKRQTSMDTFVEKDGRQGERLTSRGKGGRKAARKRKKQKTKARIEVEDTTEESSGDEGDENQTVMSAQEIECNLRVAVLAGNEIEAERLGKLRDHVVEVAAEKVGGSGSAAGRSGVNANGIQQSNTGMFKRQQTGRLGQQVEYVLKDIESGRVGRKIRGFVHNKSVPQLAALGAELFRRASGMRGEVLPDDDARLLCFQAMMGRNTFAKRHEKFLDKAVPRNILVAFKSGNEAIVELLATYHYDSEPQGGDAVPMSRGAPDNSEESLRKYTERHVRNGELRHAMGKLEDGAATVDSQDPDAQQKMLDLHPTAKDFPGQRPGQVRPAFSGDKKVDDREAEWQYNKKKAVKALEKLVKEKTRQNDNQDTDLPSWTSKVASTVFGMRGSSSEGKCSLAVRVLQTLLQASKEFQEAYANYILHLLRGEGPDRDSCSTAFIGSVLIALEKDDDNIRPIAIGRLDFRVVSKLAVWLVGKAGCEEHFGKRQRGVGTSDGVGSIIHQLRAVIEQHHDDPDFMLMQYDLRNAYNNISRTRVRQVVMRYFPWMAPWVDYMYDRVSMGMFGEMEVPSSEGTQQGDPLGPFLFSIVLQVLIDDMPAGLANLWYLDDGNFAGTRAEQEEVLELMGSDRAKANGVFKNMGKTKVVYFRPKAEGDDEFHERWGIPDENVTYSGNFKVLGTPVGSDQYAADELRLKFVKYKRTMDRLKAMKDVQCAGLLARMCTGMCKINHILRTVPFGPKVQEVLEEFQLMMRDLWEVLLSTPLTEYQWRQLELPVDMGGAGIRNPVAHWGVAYGSSLIAAQETGQFQVSEWDRERLSDWMNESMPSKGIIKRAKGFFAINLALTAKFDGDPPKITAAGMIDDEYDDGGGEPQKGLKFGRKLQGRMSRFIEMSRWLELFQDLAGGKKKATKDDANSYHAHRLASLLNYGSGAFLNATPNAAWGGRMKPQAYRTAILLRLRAEVGAPNPKGDQTCPQCVARGSRNKDQTVDAFGDHALCSCTVGNDTNHRHDKLCNEVANTAYAGGSRISIEANMNGGGDGSRAADVLVYKSAGDNNLKDMAYDVTITTSTKQSENNYSLEEGVAGTADLVKRRTEKIKKYLKQVADGGTAEFVPLVWSHFGGCDSESAEALKAIGMRAARRAGVRNPSPMPFICRLSVLVQNANADAIYRRIPGNVAAKRAYHGGRSGRGWGSRSLDPWDNG
jgi:hypothetical protein